MEYNDLSDEQKAKVAKCKTPEELLALAKEEGYALNDEEIDAASGGKWDGVPAHTKCPHWELGV
jgi:hypothetical protein